MSLALGLGPSAHYFDELVHLDPRSVAGAGGAAAAPNP